VDLLSSWMSSWPLLVGSSFLAIFVALVAVNAVQVNSLRTAIHEPRLFSLDDLKKLSSDGESSSCDSGAGLSGNFKLIGLAGRVYDVSNKPRGYFSKLAGRDVTRCLAKCDIKDSCTHVDDLSSVEHSRVATWVSHFSKCYPMVGCLPPVVYLNNVNSNDTIHDGSKPAHDQCDLPSWLTDLLAMPCFNRSSNSRNSRSEALTTAGTSAPPSPSSVTRPPLSPLSSSQSSLPLASLPDWQFRSSRTQSQPSVCDEADSDPVSLHACPVSSHSLTWPHYQQIQSIDCSSPSNIQTSNSVPS